MLGVTAALTQGLCASAYWGLPACPSVLVSCYRRTQTAPLFLLLVFRGNVWLPTPLCCRGGRRALGEAGAGALPPLCRGLGAMSRLRPQGMCLPLCEALKSMGLGEKTSFALCFLCFAFLTTRGPPWRATSWECTGAKELGRPPRWLVPRHSDVSPAVWPSSQICHSTEENNSYASCIIPSRSAGVMGSWLATRFWSFLSLSLLYFTSTSRPA